MTEDLFRCFALEHSKLLTLDEGVFLLPGFLFTEHQQLYEAVQEIIKAAPLRRLTTARGHAMSVTTTSCGDYGWVSDRRGYRYTAKDPNTGQAWPMMPPLIRNLAVSAATMAGFDGFIPDTCLINVYGVGAKMGLHQDINEQDYSQPIVSFSLGLPAIFQLGGLLRQDPSKRIHLHHGDVLVWGGTSRLRYHGIMPLRAGHHPLLGPQRINLTLRKAGA